ncbi:MAG: ribonuclease P protein component 1 [Candidatus Bathyarchaeia archaeon]
MNPITPFNILKHELIGLNVHVEKSPCKSYVCIEGEVVDETRNMLYIESGLRIKAIPKAVCKFVFTLSNGVKVEVDGIKLVGRPEDRVKR